MAVESAVAGGAAEMFDAHLVVCAAEPAMELIIPTVSLTQHMARDLAFARLALA
jgi:hypothetical protein